MQKNKINCKGKDGVCHYLTKEQFEEDKKNLNDRSKISLNTKKELAHEFIKGMEKVVKEECINCEVLIFKISYFKEWLKEVENN